MGPTTPPSHTISGSRLSAPDTSVSGSSKQWRTPQHDDRKHLDYPNYTAHKTKIVTAFAIAGIGFAATPWVYLALQYKLTLSAALINPICLLSGIAVIAVLGILCCILLAPEPNPYEVFLSKTPERSPIQPPTPLSTGPNNPYSPFEAPIATRPETPSP